MRLVLSEPAHNCQLPRVLTSTAWTEPIKARDMPTAGTTVQRKRIIGLVFKQHSCPHLNVFNQSSLFLAYATPKLVGSGIRLLQVARSGIRL